MPLHIFFPINYKKMQLVYSGLHFYHVIPCIQPRSNYMAHNQGYFRIVYLLYLLYFILFFVAVNWNVFVLIDRLLVRMTYCCKCL